MSLFYHREDKGNEVVITYTYRALFYWLLLIAFVSVFILQNIVNNWWVEFILTFGIIGLIVVFFIVYFIDLRKPDREIKQAMSKGEVTISGNKFSFSNPIKIVIQK